jgi:lipid-A-disaccharide synthase
VDFVGHPLVDEARKARAEPARELPWRGQPRVALLPGSRRQEIERILPLMIEAAVALEKKTPGVSFVLAAASDEIAALSRDVISRAARKPALLEIVTGETRQILRQAKAAMVASGTATLETALMGCPMIVVYKAAALTYLFGRLVVQVPHLGMVNLIAERELCPEFLQWAATPDAMSSALLPLLFDTPERSAMVRGLEEVAAKLGQGGAAERAAEILCAELR